MNNAFLNGVLHEEVFMPQPDGFVDATFPDYVCQLHKSLYGLRQAPRAWYNSLRLTLCNWGFVNAKSDSSLFTLHQQNDIIWVLVYVDDILVTGNNSAAVNQFIQKINAKFSLKDLGPVSFFLGVEAV